MGCQRDPAVTRFAQLLGDRIGATRVLLFGSQVTDLAHVDSDYDFVVVSPNFANVRSLQRPIGLYSLWREAGGNAPIDLFCLTPEEFNSAEGGVNLLSAILPAAIDLLALPAATE